MEKKRILIVDDDRNLSRLSAAVLEKSGLYETRTECDPRRALEIARDFRPQLMLFDVDMPEMSGGELARQAEADPQLQNTPILFLTGLLSKLHVGDETHETNGKLFLAKPVLPHVLVSSVAALLAQA